MVVDVIAAAVVVDAVDTSKVNDVVVDAAVAVVDNRGEMVAGENTGVEGIVTFLIRSS